jgi:hypothetical protein
MNGWEIPTADVDACSSKGPTQQGGGTERQWHTWQAGGRVGQHSTSADTLSHPLTWRLTQKIKLMKKKIVNFLEENKRQRTRKHAGQTPSGTDFRLDKGGKLRENGLPGRQGAGLACCAGGGSCATHVTAREAASKCHRHTCEITETSRGSTGYTPYKVSACVYIYMYTQNRVQVLLADECDAAMHAAAREAASKCHRHTCETTEARARKQRWRT